MKGGEKAKEIERCEKWQKKRRNLRVYLRKTEQRKGSRRVREAKNIWDTLEKMEKKKKER